MEDRKLRKNHFDQLMDDINGLHRTIDEQKSRIKELEEALTLLHNSCLYRLNEADDRVTHVPSYIFDVVEKALNK